MIRHWFFRFSIFSLLLLPFRLFGQQPDYKFETLPGAGNFSQSAVTKICQDKEGYLWLGSWSGLARFDGYTMRLFNQSNAAFNGLAGNKITSIYENAAGEIWIGTRNTGLFRYDQRRESFETCQIALQLPAEPEAHNITSVFQDQSGRLWIGAEEGLFYFNPEEKAIRKVALNGLTPPPSQNMYLYSIVQTADGAIWVGGSHGLFRAEGNSSTPVFQQIPLQVSTQAASRQEMEFHNFVYVVRQSRIDPAVLWLGTKHGLKRLEFIAGSAVVRNITRMEHNASRSSSLSHNFVVDICETDFPHPHSLWVATCNGLNLLAPDAGTSIVDQNAVFYQYYADNDQRSERLRGNNIRTLFCDRTGILWIGTDRGVSKLDGRSNYFSLYSLQRKSGSAPDPVSHLSATQDAIWAGTFGGGIFRIPLHNGKPQWKAQQRYDLEHPEQSPMAGFVAAVFPDHQGNMWALTQGAGAFCFNPAQLPGSGGSIRSTRHFSKGPGPLDIDDDYLMCGMADPLNRIWFGGWDSGLNCYDPVLNKNMRFPTSSDGRYDFRRYPVVCLLPATPAESSGSETENTFWMGTRGGGLFLLRYDPGVARLTVLNHYTTDNGKGLSHNAITSLQHHSDGCLWITTENGVDYIDAGKLTISHLQYSGCHLNPVAQALLEDTQGRVWVSTQSGLARLDPRNGWQVTAYNHRNGLADDFFNSNCALNLPSGILFGGNNGISVCDAAHIQPDLTPPVTALVGMRLFNRPVEPGRETREGFLLDQSLGSLPKLVLTHRDNVVSFEFSALHFSCPAQNRFAYKLDGFDPDWSFTDAGQRLAHYTNLPPGDYTFMVKSANSDGVWNENPVRLPLLVLPPWWASWWAKVLYGLLVLGLIYAGMRILLVRARYQHQIALERLENQKLEEINQMKVAFFTNISHELKTPLTLIISPLEDMIRDRHTKDTRQYGVFVRMHRNALRLLTMINQLLDIRKAEAGQMKIEVGEGNIVQFLGEICLSFRELAHHRQIRFSFHADQLQLPLWFDPDYMEKVFFNLLSNAFKFTQEEGSVSVNIGRQDEMVFVRIADSGKGIAADKLPFIFDRFYQAEEHHEFGAEGGTGIGLSLVQDIVQKHHGKVSVDSTPGVGSVFTVWLPLGSDHFSAAEKTREPFFGEPLPAFNNDLVTGEDTPVNTDTVAKQAATTETILIVEDNADIRGYLSEHFAHTYHVLEAEEGAQALDIAMEAAPDLVLCDISMPGMDGLELTRMLKNRVETSHIPVILLTARNSLIYRIDGLGAGADDYVTKPFNLQLLELRIKNLIESRKQLREKYARTLRGAELESTALSELDEVFMQKVYLIIEENLEIPDFSVDDLARKLLLNRKQVYRKIKSLTDQTPNELIRIVRLRRAAQLLKSQRFTVAEVTYKVGFQDLKYFRERFREIYGVAPSEYV